MFKVGDKLSPTKEYAMFLEIPLDSIYTITKITNAGMVYWKGPGLEPYGDYDGSPLRYIEAHMKPFQPISLENK